MILSNDEINLLVREASRNSAINRDGTTSQRIARAIEAKVLEKLSEQKPVGYFEQEYVGGPVLFYQVNYKAEGSIPLYANPIQQDDVIRDADRYRWLRKVAPNMFLDNHDKQIEFVKFDTTAHLWTPEVFDQAIDAAIKESK